MKGKMKKGSSKKRTGATRKSPKVKGRKGY